MKKTNKILLITLTILTVTMMCGSVVLAAPVVHELINAPIESILVADDDTNRLNPSTDIESVEPNNFGPEASNNDKVSSLSANIEPEVSISPDGFKKTIRVSPEAVKHIKSKTARSDSMDTAFVLWNTIGLKKEELPFPESSNLLEILECESLSATQEYYIEFIDDSGNVSTVQVSENEYNNYEKDETLNSDKLIRKSPDSTTVKGGYKVTASITQYKTHTFHALHMTYTIDRSYGGPPIISDNPLTLAIGTTDSQLYAINSAWCRAEPRSSIGKSKTMPEIQNSSGLTNYYGAECKWQASYSNADYKKLYAWLQTKGSPKDGTRSTGIDTNGKVCRSLLIPKVSFSLSLKEKKMTPSFSWYSGNIEVQANHQEASTGSWYGSNPDWRYSYNHGPYNGIGSAAAQYITNTWIANGSDWYYMKDDGYAVRGWHKVGNSFYFFDANCKMTRGWLNTGGHWYFLRRAANVPDGGPDGSMCIGLAKIEAIRTCYARQRTRLQLGRRDRCVKAGQKMATIGIIYARRRILLQPAKKARCVKVGQK